MSKLRAASSLPKKQDVRHFCASNLVRRAASKQRESRPRMRQDNKIELSLGLNTQHKALTPAKPTPLVFPSSFKAKRVTTMDAAGQHNQTFARLEHSTQGLTPAQLCNRSLLLLNNLLQPLNFLPTIFRPLRLRVPTSQQKSSNYPQW